MERTMKSLSLSLGVVAVVFGVGAAHATNVVTVESGPIRSARDATFVCQGVEASARWSGQWVTTEWGQMSVCGCEVGDVVRSRFDVEAGPIWSNVHAQSVCPSVCSDARWTGGYAFDARSGGACTLDYPGEIRGRVNVVGPYFGAAVPVARPVVVASRPAYRPVHGRFARPHRGHVIVGRYAVR